LAVFLPSAVVLLSAVICAVPGAEIIALPEMLISLWASIVIVPLAIFCPSTVVPDSAIRGIEVLATFLPVFCLWR
jgi:hypothetical protein